MSEQAGTSKGRGLRDWVTITQGALLLVAIILIGTLISGAGRPRAARAQGPGGPGGGFQGGPQGPFGRGPMGQQEQKLVKQFDKNKDDRLDNDERQAARAWLAENGGGGRGFGGGRRGGGRGMAAGSPGRALKTADVKSYGNEPLYDPAVLRTIFLQFENDDWEQELAAFNNTDVEVPAVVTVDGRTYRNVGVHFRGMSSFFMVPAGSKRSLNLTFDFVDEKQSLLGYRTLNLLNVNGDPTFVRAMLYSDIARSYIPAPKTNYLRVAINGESWGVYINAQQYNKDFVRDYFKTEQGARWKVPGNPGGRGGMEYWGDDPSAYKQTYDIRTKDDPKVWASLIQMFKVLNETPPDKLEAALSPLLDIDGVLRFLAIDNALVNTDGYWTRASDYSIYQDVKGQFHVIPHDMNEALINEGGRGRGPGGPPPDFGRGGPGGPPPGFGGPDGPPPGMGPRGGRGFGPGGGGPTLDPLIGLNHPSKPLRSKLLAVPALRARYLGYVRDIAEKWLDWRKLGPMAKTYQDLIREEVNLDTRKLYLTEVFEAGLEGGAQSVKTFVDERRGYLLKVTDPKAQLK
jgi:CotH kinase protein